MVFFMFSVSFWYLSTVSFSFSRVFFSAPNKLVRYALMWPILIVLDLANDVMVKWADKRDFLSVWNEIIS